jgi:hypothetical protein
MRVSAIQPTAKAIGKLSRAFPKMASSEVTEPEARMLETRFAKQMPARA